MKQLLFTLLTCVLAFNTQCVRGQGNKKDLSVSKINQKADQYNVENSKKPLIGISASNSNNASRLATAYSDAVIKSGGIPLIIPVTNDIETLKLIAEKLDGLILSGGGDVNPPYYNDIADKKCNLDIDTLRDEYEFILLRFAINRNVPILGICRGQQLINVAFGGTLYQDIAVQYKTTNIKHKQAEPREQATHKIQLVEGTLLSKLFDNKTELAINSIHHQSVKDVAKGFKVSAYGSDGIIEAIEAYPNRNIVAVQWHPEALIAGKDESMLALFDFLVEKAEIFKKAKRLHSQILSVDTHTDTPLCFTSGFNIVNRDSNQINLPKMQEGYLDGVFMAAYIRQGKRDVASSKEAVKKVTALIEGIHRQIKMNPTKCGLAHSSEDLKNLKKANKKAIFIGIENGYGIGKDIENLAKYKKLGVTYMTLCHTSDNDICDTSSKTKNEWKGLSPFGKKVVAEMNELGMMIDISHAGESTFWDVIELSKYPIVATHSSARALCDHDRNLTDEQLKALAKNGGVAQVCPVDMFVNKDKKNANLTDFIAHINYIVKIAGIDHVGIGSDFDGGGGVIGCEGANDLINVTTKLIENGYSDEQISKIWGGNFLRVLNRNQNKVNGGI